MRTRSESSYERISMAFKLVGKAFEEGVKAALKLFQQPEITREIFARSGETVLKNLTKAMKAAAKSKVK